VIEGAVRHAAALLRDSRRSISSGMGRFLIIIGVILVVIGVLWPALSRLGLGRLPGDIYIRGQHGAFYFPIVTCIVVSIALSLLFWLLNR
jgi:multisubunit Na+/H+ antiporter MnhG subunit